MFDSKTIVVWFSCGAASAVAAKKTIEIYGSRFNVRVVNNPVVNEDSDNRRFLKDCEKWLGCKIETAVNPKWPNCDITEVFEKKHFMSSPNGAPCTRELKINARLNWEKHNDFDYYVFGFTSEEKNRHDKLSLIEPYPIIPLLIELDISKNDCYSIVQKAGISLPRMYHLGFPNANCIACVKATSPTYWQLVRKEFPEVFAERAEQSRNIGAKLTRYKGNRIFLDELPLDAVGNPLKSMPDCGILCNSD